MDDAEENRKLLQDAINKVYGEPKEVVIAGIRMKIGTVLMDYPGQPLDAGRTYEIPPGTVLVGADGKVIKA